MKPAYYNENNPECVPWLYELMGAGVIAPGYVDDRSIEDVRPADLDGFGQCHFFAGVGVWSYALRLAGWPDDRSVWTGSCPCQPFSAAGKGAGFADERHLWPAWFQLIAQRVPAVVLGEQVASRDGRTWLDLVRADLEGLGLAFGAADLCAASVGAPHIRQRLFWVADAQRGAAKRQRLDVGNPEGSSSSAWEQRLRADAGSGSYLGGLADSSGPRLSKRQPEELSGAERDEEGGATVQPGSAWSEVEWLPCRDGVSRPTQPGLFPLAHGAPARMGRLRAYGNAIVPQVAAAFIESYMTCE